MKLQRLDWRPAMMIYIIDIIINVIFIIRQINTIKEKEK